MRISKSICINLRSEIFPFGLTKWITRRYSIPAILAVVPHRIDPDNTAPDPLRQLIYQWISNFCTSSISNTYIEESVVFVAFFCKAVKCDFLNPMNCRRHIYPENFPAITGEWEI